MSILVPGIPGPLNIQCIPTPILWIGPEATHGPGALPGLQESQQPYDYILTSEDGERIIPSEQ